MCVGLFPGANRGSRGLVIESVQGRGTIVPSLTLYFLCRFLSSFLSAISSAGCCHADRRPGLIRPEHSGRDFSRS